MAQSQQSQQSAYMETRLNGRKVEDHDEAQQFEIGFGIIQEAFRNEMATLVNKINSCKAEIEDKTARIDELTDKQHEFDLAYQDAENRLQSLVEDNLQHLSSIKSMRGQVDKLKQFKEYKMTKNNQGVLHSVSDAEAAATASDMYEQPYSHETSQGMGGASGSVMQSGALGSPEPYNVVGSFEDSGVDGKEFFKHVRTRLSYESFNSFLASIKKLNSHQQTREDTLEEAKQIFGRKDTDLYAQFEKLLSRHI